MNVGLKEIVSFVESDNNQYAIRFEADIFCYNRRKVDNRIIESIRKAHKYMSRDTARMIYFSSWGMYQIMGFNLYRFYIGPIALFLCNKKEQEEAFDRFMTPFYTKYSEKDIIDCLEFLFANNIALNDIENYRVELLPLIKFIEYYNGSIFPSVNFKNYLGRMIHYYKTLGGKA